MEITHNISRFEYETFNLADCNTPSLKYRQLSQDIHDSSQSISQFVTHFVGDELTSKFIDVLISLTDELEEEYSKEELIVTEAEEREYWVRKLGKQAAIEMVIANTVTYNTMNKLSSLPDDDFDRAVALSNVMARELDARVKAVEATASNNL